MRFSSSKGTWRSDISMPSVDMLDDTDFFSLSLDVEISGMPVDDATSGFFFLTRNRFFKAPSRVVLLFVFVERKKDCQKSSVCIDRRMGCISYPTFSCPTIMSFIRVILVVPSNAARRYDMISSWPLACVSYRTGEVSCDGGIRCAPSNTHLW